MTSEESAIQLRLVNKLNNHSESMLEIRDDVTLLIQKTSDTAEKSRLEEMYIEITKNIESNQSFTRYVKDLKRMHLVV